MLDTETDESLKSRAEGVLQDGGCHAVRVEGAGQSWFVSCGYAPDQFLVVAYSAKCPHTPNDPVYLAHQALAALERNERPQQREVKHETPIPEGPRADEAAEAAPDFVGFGDRPAPGEDHGGAEDGEPSGGGALQPYDGQDGPGDGEREYAFDADYEEAGEGLGAELLDDEAFAKPALDAPEPEDFAPDEMPPVKPPVQDRFIGLDDLDRVRKLRIGDVAAEAAILIEAIERSVSEKTGEHQALTSFVVTNLDKFTGAFTLQDAASLASYKRWVDLDAAHGQISVIDLRRKEATAFLLTADREAVVNFNVEAAFV